jgi:hypothetical protein
MVTFQIQKLKLNEPAPGRGTDLKTEILQEYAAYSNKEYLKNSGRTATVTPHFFFAV